MADNSKPLASAASPEPAPAPVADNDDDNSDNNGHPLLEAPNAACYKSLLDMGFEDKDAYRAASLSSHVDTAMEYILSGFAHVPRPQPARHQGPSRADLIKSLMEMGVGREDAELALRYSGARNVEEAMEWVLTIGAAQQQDGGAKGEVKEAKQGGGGGGGAGGGGGGVPDKPQAPPLAPEEKKRVLDGMLLQKAIWLCDKDALRQYFHRDVCNEADVHGNTPLMLAHKLGYDDVVHWLLERGADPRVRNAQGWNVLQEACLLKEKQMVLDMYMHLILLKQEEWEKRLPILRADLEKMQDFYMEVEWKVESWIPFVSSMAPSDVFKIWKRKDQLRFDSNFRGMDGANVQKGLMSYLFSGKSVYLVDHVSRTWEDALREFRNPSFDRIEAEVSTMLHSDVGWSDFISDHVKFTVSTSFLGSIKTERVGRYNCHLMDMTGLVFSMVTMPQGTRPEQLKQAMVLSDFDQYFAAAKSVEDDGGSAGVQKQQQEEKKKAEKPLQSEKGQQLPVAGGGGGGPQPEALSEAKHSSAVSERPTAVEKAPAPSVPQSAKSEGDKAAEAAPVPAPQTVHEDKQQQGGADGGHDGLKSVKKQVSATLWMSKDFELTQKDMLTILEIVSPASTEIAKLKDFLAVKLPAGFPVKLTIPVAVGTSAVVTFGQFQKKQIPDDICRVPEDYVLR